MPSWLRKNIPCFEVPTGWKFFGNLMDSGTSYFPGKERIKGPCITLSKHPVVVELDE